MSADDRTVLVLGAGASVAEAKPHRPKLELDHPPLDANFFSKAARHANRSRLQAINAHAEQLGQQRLSNSFPPVSLEQYLGRLFFEMNSSSSPSNIQAYFDLVRLY